MTWPSAKKLGVDERELYKEMCATEGKTHAELPSEN
jgi:hypothetical protein